VLGVVDHPAVRIVLAVDASPEGDRGLQAHRARKRFGLGARQRAESEERDQESRKAAHDGLLKSANGTRNLIILAGIRSPPDIHSGSPLEYRPQGGRAVFEAVVWLDYLN
jgi:hypothetical protein